MSIEPPFVIGFAPWNDKSLFICRLETDLKQANDEKKEMEAQFSEFGLKLENLENGRHSSITCHSTT